MTANRNHKPVTDLGREPKIGRFALLSLVLHLAAAVLFSGVLIPHPVREHRPVYFVDLSKLPVANPRAGRPDGSSQPAQKPPAPKPPPAADPKTAATPSQPAPPPKSPEPAPKPEKPIAAVKPKEEKPAAPAKSKSTKTAAAKAKPDKSSAEKSRKTETASQKKPSQTAKAEAEKDYQETLGAIKALQAKAEREALKEKLAALAAMDTRNSAGDSGSDVPLGMPDGTGDEAGVGEELWLQKFLKQNWSFSKYQASRRDLEATTRIKYDTQGNLMGYEFVKKSGDSNFDDSVTKAILKEKKLPFSPKNRIDIVVTFNLKDLMD